MSQTTDLIGQFGKDELVTVERAVAEIRAGRPVVVRAGRARAIAVGVEALSGRMAQNLQSLASRNAHLVLPGARLRVLGLERRAPGVIALPQIDLERINHLTLAQNARFDAPVATLSKIDEAALELIRLALILPGVVVVPVAARSIDALNLVEVAAQDVMKYRGAQSELLHVVSRAPVPLEDAGESEFVVFRGGEGMRDQVAIIVGKPDIDGPVTVRLHSACLTGDLFGSLKCDCGDQLRHTVKFMAENGGGVLLYLDQEGRGNGIANKMRAYRLQAEGFDTYDADEMLGFDNDQRNFDFAAEMLHKLGISKVRIMTNNPLKIAALEEAGLEVVADQRILGRLTDHNVRYLASKRDRAGHIIDIETSSEKSAGNE